MAHDILASLEELHASTRVRVEQLPEYRAMIAIEKAIVDIKAVLVSATAGAVAVAEALASPEKAPHSEPVAEAEPTHPAPHVEHADAPNPYADAPVAGETDHPNAARQFAAE